MFFKVVSTPRPDNGKAFDPRYERLLNDLRLEVHDLCSRLYVHVSRLQQINEQRHLSAGQERTLLKEREDILYSLFGKPVDITLFINDKVSGRLSASVHASLVKKGILTNDNSVTHMFFTHFRATKLPRGTNQFKRAYHEMLERHAGIFNMALWRIAAIADIYSDRYHALTSHTRSLIERAIQCLRRSEGTDNALMNEALSICKDAFERLSAESRSPERIARLATKQYPVTIKRSKTGPIVYMTPGYRYDTSGSWYPFRGYRRVIEYPSLWKLMRSKVHALDATLEDWCVSIPKLQRHMRELRTYLEKEQSLNGSSSVRPEVRTAHGPVSAGRNYLNIFTGIRNAMSSMIKVALSERSEDYLTYTGVVLNVRKKFNRAQHADKLLLLIDTRTLYELIRNREFEKSLHVLTGIEHRLTELRKEALQMHVRISSAHLETAFNLFLTGSGDVEGMHDLHNHALQLYQDLHFLNGAEQRGDVTKVLNRIGKAVTRIINSPWLSEPQCSGMAAVLDSHACRDADLFQLYRKLLSEYRIQRESKKREQPAETLTVMRTIAAQLLVQAEIVVRFCRAARHLQQEYTMLLTRHGLSLEDAKDQAYKRFVSESDLPYKDQVNALVYMFLFVSSTPEKKKDLRQVSPLFAAAQKLFLLITCSSFSDMIKSAHIEPGSSACSYLLTLSDTKQNTWSELTYEQRKELILSLGRDHKLGVRVVHLQRLAGLVRVL